VNPRQSAVLGPLVADAATLGLHWLYDPVRLAEIAQRGPVTFTEPDARNYAGTRGYFAHGGKRAGDLSVYGETAGLVLLHLAGSGGAFRRMQYQQQWRAHFGPGGAFVGYADKPTRALCARLLASDKPEDWPARSGADDDQMPALESVPAITAVHCGSPARGDDAALARAVEEAVAVTNDNPLAIDGALTLARALAAVIAGTPMRTALADAAGRAGATLKPLLVEALGMPAFDPVAATAKFGAPCHMHQGLPVAFHILAHAKGFTHAVEANILASGDSCGRAMAIGSVAGAAFCGADAMPLAWIAKVTGMARYAGAAEQLFA
jgi:hypothetical protein